MSYPAPLVTAEEFATIPDDDCHFELVEGRVIRVSLPGSLHGALMTRIAMLLALHVDTHHLGVVMTSGGFKLATNPDTVRGPDVAFVRRESIPEAGIPEGFWPGTPDLAIEIRSPGDRPSEILAKVDDYLTRGVRLVWVVEPRRKSVTVYRRLLPPVTLGVDETLDALDVVPGFVCEVRRIFD